MNKNTKRYRLVNKYGMKEIIIFCNGACEGNPGPGGWAAIIIDGEGWLTVEGGDPLTTNNRMELQAVVSALGALREPSKVRLITDSVDVRDVMSKWKAQGWRTTAGTRVKNEDLWKQLHAQAAKHQIICERVKAHADQNPCERFCLDAIVADINDVCDALAKHEIQKIRNENDRYDLVVILEQFKKRHEIAIK